MAARKKGPPKGYAARRTKESETATVEIRRKNFELDQRQIDRVREVLGARTETEAITLAMDLALAMASFRAEVAEGSAKLFGRGGFVNRFDDQASLDYGGFEGRAGASPPASRRSRAGRQA